MRRHARKGQTTVEFALVFSLFAVLLFGAIEVARAIYEKDTLARAAETIAQELAQTDPENGGLAWTLQASDVTTALGDANRRAGLGLSTVWPQNGTFATGYFNAATNQCDAAGTGTSCVSALNQDGSVLVIGYPDLTSPTTIAVTVREPYKSYLVYPLQFLGGNASETVTATTLAGQQ